MDNYTQLSGSNADGGVGFQFEFRCQSCDTPWRSQFKPYRRGQLAELMGKLAYFVHGRAMSLARRGSGGIADVGHKKARNAALEQALEQAQQIYAECGSCRKVVCRKCWDRDSGQCRSCTGEAHRADQLDGRAAPAAMAEAGAIVCPSCGQRAGGGRFCDGCGFDLASTHKSCPSCGAMVARNVRFCADCGHGF
jgi:Double zinc ribbon